MAQTIVGLNDAKAVKRFSGQLAVDTARQSYFTRKFMGKGEGTNMPIMQLNELESEAGEQITYDLSVQLKMEPVEGDTKLEGKEEGLKFYTDALFIDQQRGGVNAGGRMTRKRTLHNLRNTARKRSAEWWARVFDETLMCYLSGARGVNADFLYPTTWTGRANNSLTAPDADHLVVAGGKVKGTLTADDKFDLALIDKAVVAADMMGGGTQEVPKIQPINIDGALHFVCVMNPWQAYDVRTATGEGKWLDIQKAAAGAEGRKSPIFDGNLGMYNDVVLHKHQAIVRFSDYGAGNVLAARALFLGAQAATLAFGSPGSGMRFQWHEEEQDRGNEVVITTHCIWGAKKTTYNGVDFGVIAIDTAAKAP